MIYQRTAPSFPQQRFPRVALPLRVSPAYPPPLCFYLTDQLTSRQPKKPWEPLWMVCRHWIIGFRRTCSSISAASQYGVSVYSCCADYGAAGVLYRVIVYRGLELEKQACHLTELGHSFRTEISFLHRLDLRESCSTKPSTEQILPPNWCQHNPNELLIAGIKIRRKYSSFIKIPINNGSSNTNKTYQLVWKGICKCRNRSFVRQNWICV